MQITHVTTRVRDLDEATDFYGHALGLPVRPTDAGLEVSLGQTLLELHEDPRSTATDHLGFDVPHLPEARAWLQRRGVPLLARDGRDESEMAPAWNARSIYFEGPSGSILELIERRDLGERPVPDPAPIRRISEVGIATADVPGARHRLEPFGLGVYGDLANEGFAPIGDLHGLLILVAAGRVWMPTENTRAVMAPLEIAVSGPLGLDLTIGSARIRSIDRQLGYDAPGI